ncbi:hypothetical protein PBY51_010304 [Eleginops maclovinus]|uniref:Uncharacterized protein n=1 Tax=Eleginops maclovinus TaxID=56733 RepID=A0AAN7XCD5_ELEMC|nr:hypothetical protein PBY51_010304 [Eleginops maclovinus]
MRQKEGSRLPPIPLINAFEDTLPSTPKPPSSFLDGPDSSNQQLSYRLQPCLNMVHEIGKQTPVHQLQSPKQTRAPAPPYSSPCLPQSSKTKCAPPPPPSRQNQLSPEPDKDVCVEKATSSTDMCWVQAQGRMGLSTLSRTCRDPACQ